jgi:hypothetical protein
MAAQAAIHASLRKGHSDASWVSEQPRELLKLTWMVAVNAGHASP